MRWDERSGFGEKKAVEDGTSAGDVEAPTGNDDGDGEGGGILWGEEGTGDGSGAMVRGELLVAIGEPVGATMGVMRTGEELPGTAGGS